MSPLHEIHASHEDLVIRRPYSFYATLAHEPADSFEKLATALADAFLNPHQVDAALFALQSPFSKDALLTDKVVLGKRIDPLRAALGLAAAGYVEAAVQLLDQKQYTVETAMGDGLEALQHYHGLMLRAAQQRGDVEAARDHAGNVLRWAGLSPDAAHAAQVIAGDQSVDDGHRLAASLIGGLGTPGAALDLFGTTLLAKPAGVATRRESA